jgi:uncharacterized protein
MLMVLSPAKSLDFETAPHVAEHTRPAFLKQSAQLIAALRQFDARGIAQLMDLSDSLATLNVARYQAWTTSTAQKSTKQAILAFDGDVYAGLDAKTLTEAQLQWAQAHLRILSGLYGVLRPFDRIAPHRLEMGTSLAVGGATNLVEFWGDTQAKALNAAFGKTANPVLVNLASMEYFKSVSRKALKARVVECRFEEKRAGVYKVVSFAAKRARGQMARYAIVHELTAPEQLQAFREDGYRFDAKASTADVMLFRRLSPTVSPD